MGSAGEVDALLREAWRLAQEGEPGPVLLHLVPEALREAVGPAGGGTRSVDPGAHPGADRPPDPDWADALRTLVAAAERPVIFAGGGALSSAEELRALAERLTAPTFTTLTARGILPEDHRCALAFDADRGGLSELNELLDRADLILALGCKFSHNGTSGFRLRLAEDRLVHVNTDPEALGSTYPRPHGDPGAGRGGAARGRGGRGARVRVDGGGGRRGEGAHRRGPRRRACPSRASRACPAGTPEAFFGALRRALPRDGTVVTDSGLHQVMTRRYLEVLRPGGLLAPADLQSMGFGVPAAIGAAISEPSGPVVAVVGDGGFLMAAMDLACAARERVPVTVVVFNDGYLNLIRVQQLRDEGNGSGVTLETPHLEALAASMGVDYRLVDGDPEGVLRAGDRASRPDAGRGSARRLQRDARHARRGPRDGRRAQGAPGRALIGRLKGFVKGLRRR